MVLLHIFNETRIFNISLVSASLNTFWFLLPHLSQITEKTNVLSKMCDNLGYLNFNYLLHLKQYIFFIKSFSLESIYKINFLFHVDENFSVFFFIISLVFIRGKSGIIWQTFTFYHKIKKSSTNAFAHYWIICLCFINICCNMSLAY